MVPLSPGFQHIWLWLQSPIVRANVVCNNTSLYLSQFQVWFKTVSKRKMYHVRLCCYNTFRYTFYIIPDSFHGVSSNCFHKIVYLSAKWLFWYQQNIIQFGYCFFLTLFVWQDEMNWLTELLGHDKSPRLSSLSRKMSSFCP